MKKFFLIAVILTGCTLFLNKIAPNFFQRLDSMWADRYFDWRGPIDMTESDIVLITIDEKSLTKLGRWPWPRATMANAVEALRRYEMKSVGFDITFAETSSEDTVLREALQNFVQATLGYFFYPSQE